MKLVFSRLFVFLLFVNGLFSGVFAQQEKPLSIIDPGQLYASYTLSTSDQAAIIAAVGAEKFDAINLSCHESQWPSGIRDLDSRNNQSGQIKQYHIKLVINLGERSIVEISPGENKHMPADMQSASSFYFVIGSIGIGFETDAPDNTAISDSSDDEFYYSLFGDEFPLVQIIDPGQLISGYTFTEDEIQDIKDQIGEDGYEYVNSYCREESWPKGIDNLEKRLALSEEIKNYTAFLVAETGDISILEVTPEENTNMPALLQPESIFYFVIKSDGIVVLN
jgi:hypothetical protein